MEQTIQKQTSGCYSYCVRSMLSGTGQNTCVICSGYKEHPLDAASSAALAQFVKEQSAQLSVVYHIPQSLSHYGKVDSLVTAGAMSDFVDYVYSLEQDEAQKFFTDLTQTIDCVAEDATKRTLVQAMGDIVVIREPHEWKKLLQHMQNQYAQVLLFSPK